MEEVWILFWRQCPLGLASVLECCTWSVLEGHGIFAQCFGGAWHFRSVLEGRGIFVQCFGGAWHFGGVASTVLGGKDVCSRVWNVDLLNEESIFDARKCLRHLSVIQTFGGVVETACKENSAV